MAKLKNITDWLNDYLNIDAIQDSCWNGLQIEGSREVAKIALAVDAAADIFKLAYKEKADMVIVHHGHFWQGANPSYAGWQKERLSPLLDNNISLYAAHLPLDRHPDIGHNAQILKKLGFSVTEEFYIKNGVNIGWIGHLTERVERNDIINRVNQELNTKAIVLPFGADKIQSIAVCSGSGGYGGFYEALNKNVDLYITGDSIEIYQTAKDAKMNIAFAGHYATETLGLKALGEVLKKEHAVETVFIDMPTGL